MVTFVNSLQAAYSDNLKSIGNWLDENPTVNTVVVVANHVFRAVSMYALMEIIPGSFVVKAGVTLAASLFYRVTIERFCLFRFALLSCLGGTAIKLSLPALNELVSVVGGRAVASSSELLLGLSPFLGYLGAAFWVSYTTIQQRTDLQHKVASAANGETCGSCCQAT